MERLYSPRLEASALRSITSGNDRIAGWLFPRLSREHFSLAASHDFYHRIRILTRKHGTLPAWDDLLDDLAISEESRDEMQHFPSAVVDSRRGAQVIIERLDEYRRARTFYTLQKVIAKDIRGDRLELEVMEERLADFLTRLRHRTSLDDITTSFGGDRLDVKALREVLEPNKNEFLPTGFRNFDTINQGIPRESCFVIAGPTSGGKSALALNLAVNQARIGIKVSLTSLEMSRKANNRRLTSCLTAIPLSQVNRVNEMDRSTRKMIAEAWRDFHAQVKRNGGRFDILCPEEDVTIEEHFTSLRHRGYDNNIVDYMGLLKGMDEEDQWRKLGAGARFAKHYTRADASVATLLAQLSEEGILRYSRMVQEHASLMWTWPRPDENGITTVKQPKAREVRPFDFLLRFQFGTMRVSDVDVSEVNGEGQQKRSSARKRLPAPTPDNRIRDDSEKDGGSGDFHM